MTSLIFFFVGSVLLLNGLGLLGLVGPKATAPINTFVGVSLLASVLFVVLPVRGTQDADLSTVLGAAGYLLFAFTYLYVAVNNYAGFPGHGLGWYCGWAALVSVFLSWINFDRFQDAKFGTIWLAWAVLFGAFFAVLALDIDRLARPTGWLTVLESFTTCTIPGALLLIGAWDSTPTVAIVAAQAIPVAVFAITALASKPKAGESSASPIRERIGAQQ
jgi:putative amide transporter protein